MLAGPINPFTRENRMTSELSGSARPRPTRVAFLVEEGEHAHLALDGIFADCYGRWGGRYSLIVPCVNGRASPAYWSWLETFDPDIVYSYVPLSRADILEIHERLCPSRYYFHRLQDPPRLDVFGFKPSYDFQALSSLSIIFRAARFTSPFGEGGPLIIIDKWHGEDPSRFLTDNLGTYLSSRATSIYPADARIAANLLTIVSPEKMADRRFGISQNLTTAPDELAAFRAFATRGATSMAVISLLLAPKIEIEGGSWGRSFNLVVGSSFADRVMFWNARLLLPSWLDTDTYCLRVDEEQLADADFVAVLGELLKRRNHVTAGNGGQTNLTVRSCSLPTNHLEAARTVISSTQPWGSVTIEQVPSLDALVPSDDVLARARENYRLGPGYRGPVDFSEFVWTGSTIRPPPATPDHLSDAPARQAFTQGYWSTDFILGIAGPKARGIVLGRWDIPRRWRMAGAFKFTRVDAVANETALVARRSRSGALALSESLQHPIETISVPTVEEAMFHAFVADGAWADPKAEHGALQPPAPAVWMEPSNEARYLAGVLGMASGLEWAEAFLLHPFLRGVLAKLGGAPSVPADKVVPAANLLRKQVGYAPIFDLREERERNALATMIVKAGRNLKAPADEIKFNDLKADWATYRAAYWQAKPHQHAVDQSVDWDAMEARSLEQCLVSLRRRKMFFQGHQWTCPNCHHRNWVDMVALTPSLRCEVCATADEAPVDVRWRFRPNEFLIESLRDHSVLSLIWVLAELRSRARMSFLYCPPMVFGDAHEQGPVAEADLLVVHDGKAIVCEVKSSWQVLRLADIDKLVAIAKRLRPDEALLAVMGAGSGPTEALQKAELDLAEAGIRFRLMTLAPSALRDDPYLPYD